ncbi:MAG: phage integrase N-terminal SAM-like domain-containing protein [Kiritimatiellae bacterium]|nr:phage integrase N-terminal SAM-like domain-containing protein [Kiritimatiellia bacterium]MDD4026370.1 phage integrase N-terminal SAM-like domain-containing protein [Kiritimatiellia bacterium]MDD4623109.1 phage integrase N-terminal SAM-like domain-containing protein [Kiritimatiellia bacterium]
MSPLREEALLQMRLRGFAPKTVEAYIYAMKVLCRFYMRPLESLTCAEVQRFLDEVITVCKRAWATVNVYFSAYRFLKDVDRERMRLFVGDGKGRKDRYTVLSARALSLLEDLWREERPSEYFFTRAGGDRPLNDCTAQALYYAALRASGVRRVGGIHVLRHCFATHLKTNPFLSEAAVKAYPRLEKYFSGEARFDAAAVEIVRDVLESAYPQVRFGYNPSLCGAACQRACLAHLERKGVLTRTFTNAFRP